MAESVRRKAVFLDRDGVINRALTRDGKPYPPTTLEEFEILPGVVEACARLKQAGFLLVVATNQPDVGRGTLAQSTVESLHEHLRQKIALDRIDVFPPATTTNESAPAISGCDVRTRRPVSLDKGANIIAPSGSTRSRNPTHQLQRAQ